MATSISFRSIMDNVSGSIRALVPHRSGSSDLGKETYGYCGCSIGDSRFITVENAHILALDGGVGGERYGTEYCYIAMEAEVGRALGCFMRDCSQKLCRAAGGTTGSGPSMVGLTAVVGEPGEEEDQEFAQLMVKLDTKTTCTLHMSAHR